MSTDKPSSSGAESSVIAEFLKSFEDPKPGTGSPWVLIVDDEPSVRRMVSRSMSTLADGVKVYEAENGLQALEKLDEGRKHENGDPLLVVTDLQMPVMDGWDFIDRLWDKFQKEGRPIGVPLIVLSASSGTKGFLMSKSVHGEKCKYYPLATVAKEDCVKPVKYDSQGEKGLQAWVKYFMHKY